MAEKMYHVFYEDHDLHKANSGFYIGAYTEREEAEKMGKYVWDLFVKSNYTDNIKEIREAAKPWREYKVFPDTEFTLLHCSGVITSSGLSSILVFPSKEKNFVDKYIEFRGTTQPELFPIQLYEKCIMYNFKQKRLVAQEKEIRRGKKGLEKKNLIVISRLSEDLIRERKNIIGLKRFFWKEIEVTQKFFDDIEFHNEIFISIEDGSVKNEIIGFDNYFKHDVALKVHLYDEEENIIYFDNVNNNNKY